MTRAPFFSPGVAGEVYAFQRDDASRGDVRAFCEAQWELFEPYCADPAHFLREARTDFHARTWEMMLACLLLEHGFQLERPPGDGPDIKIVAGPHGSPGPIWIEATTVELGEGPNNSHRQEYPIPELLDDAGRAMTENSCFFIPQEEPTILRYTSALEAKRKQRAKFGERGIVADSDPFLVAVNGALLHDHSIDDDDPEVLKAVYPIGAAYVSFPRDGGEPVAGNRHRPKLTKASGATVATTAFLSDEYRQVSGLLFSQARAWDPRRVRARHHETLTIHNRRAASGLPPGLLRCGREAVFDDSGGIRWIRH